MVNITDSEFTTEVLEYKGLVVVDFWATWCPPCLAMAPILESLAEEFKDKIKIVKIDVDENQETTQNCGVRAMPTFIFFKDGKEVDRKVGAMSKNKFKELLEKL